jgi:hypothetical protein
MMFRIVIVLLSLQFMMGGVAAAQSFEVGAVVAMSQWSEFDGTDVGFGGRVTWKPTSIVGIDAEVVSYPSDFSDRVAFSRSRFEGLFGATVGPQLNRVRPFAKAAVGFLDVGATPGAFACIAIFPPPMACVLANGRTLPAYEIGGGVDVGVTAKTFIRADITDRMLQYPGPTLGDDFVARDDGFIGHALRFTVGGGWRF